MELCGGLHVLGRGRGLPVPTSLAIPGTVDPIYLSTLPVVVIVFIIIALVEEILIGISSSGETDGLYPGGWPWRGRNPLTPSIGYGGCLHSGHPTDFSACGA
jgi:hypothetical protein